ncbi:hypothetical protein [Microbacterium resistens]|uniref:CU044_5270 family protein n=1 Tax=Microbacterium resistens TaxID=156977 RepID=A0ABY3RVW7_9MICO|nr:hypothetical protein [Microbacterium resistens]UGS27110.1 hypothetical protein K8F61_02545 [Microbacterium resistens]
MDDWREVRTIGENVRIDEARLRSARERLLSGIEAEPGRRASLRRRLAWGAGGIIATAAATTVAVIVASQGVPRPELPVAVPATSRPETPPATPLPSPSAPSVPTPTPAPETAPDVLRAAANAALTTPSAPGAGQYVKYQATSEYLWAGDGTDFSPIGRGFSREMATRAWIITGTSTMYIPADVLGDWVVAPSDPSAISWSLVDDPTSEERIEAELAASASAGEGTYPGGTVIPESAGERVGELLARLPADPGAIREWAESEYPGENPSAEDSLGSLLVLLLGYNAGSPQLRSAMFLALSDLPASSIVAESGTTRTIAFAAAVGGEGRPWRMTVTMDVESGLVSEITRTWAHGPNAVPDDIPDERIRIATSIVDAPPEG